MEDKFTDVHDEHPLIALKKLQQEDGTVAAYEQVFDELLSEVDIPEAVAVNLFIGGLRPDIQQFVLTFAPTTLAKAACSARLQEATIQAIHDHAPGLARYRKSSSGALTGSYGSGPKSATVLGPLSGSSSPAPKVSAQTSSKQSPSLSPFVSSPPTLSSAASNVRPTRQLPKRELDERRRKGLCYWCPEKYTPGHRCQDSHVFSLVITEEEDQYEDAVGDVQPIVDGAINAIEGRENTYTLKLLGRIKHHQIIILLDTGSTHNILDISVAKRLNIKVQDQSPIRLAIADSRQVSVSKHCPDLTWEMGEIAFTSDFLVMKIGGYDAILGVQWLKTLGRFSMDMELHLFEFQSHGQLIQLHGLSSVNSVSPEEVKVIRELLTANQLYLLHTSSQLQVDLTSQLPLSGNQPTALQGLLDQFIDVFAEPRGLPPVQKFDHAIPLIDDRPICCKPYRYGPVQKTEIEKQIQQMLDTGIIRESCSAFAAPVVLVQKKEGTWRFCVDYRKLNEATIKNKFPIPVIEELLDELTGANYFSKLDLRAGYHQIRMKEADIVKTAFRTHEGLYEFLVMPFGLTNAPATFQGLMNSVFKDLLRKFILVFFDDILIYSPTWEAHLQHLHTTLLTLRQHRLFAKASKCTFAATQLDYLGHIISGQGVKADPKKLEAIASWPEPTSLRELRGLLGLTG